MIRDAASVVAVDAHIVDYAFARVAVLDRPPMYVIPNGYDEDDFRGTVPADLPGVFHRAHRPAPALAAPALGRAVAGPARAAGPARGPGGTPRLADRGPSTTGRAADLAAPTRTG